LKKERNRRLFSGLVLYVDTNDSKPEFVIVDPKSRCQKVHAYFLLRWKRIRFAVPKNWREIKNRSRYTSVATDVLRWK